MRTQQKLRLAGIILALLTALIWAQPGDTPIVISDGSLTINSAVPWNQYTGPGDLKSHPHSTKSVTSVEVTMNGTSQAVSFHNEPCNVDVTYASAHIVFSTGAAGKGLSMRPFGAFHRGANANILEHNNQAAKISHVTITKGATRALDADANGNTRITIHYQ